MAGLRLNPKKCSFGYDEVPLLGHVITARGNTIPDNQVTTIRNLPIPRNVDEVKSAIGLAGYYQQYVKDFSTVAAPINRLRRKGAVFKWTQECDKAWETLKDALTSQPILARPDFTKEFIVQTDASGVGLGAILAQKDAQDQERVIYYASRSLSEPEKNYSTTEQECLAVFFAVTKFRPYLHGTHFTLITDHSALTWLLKTSNLPAHNRRLNRWVMELQACDFTVIHKKGKANSNVDALSRLGH